ncbi:putative tRNA sulfurtransferase [Weizmannia acidilactici]|uniref:Probable tRNA sulfurtransferase n=1 Tax=Weizmannia acidilactici TaxID=2607726 RepID=A0A5J4JG44_9BACI|nr:tRNA uracil 4-sulfurtransferase ThiI [Weizmannia acidilactici]GER66404.1 putative tRNA sulfurtransferase [Weizmannia acidilactici]GER69450.1 putative tRNA sulfurtransferase [Weizmannia acidilactici]GER72221.1 putative tRNA sulfurtransferase [Weizmannia acidilactici]
MNYDQILIRYGELSTKGHNRQFFIRHLKDNIKKALKPYKGIQVQALYDRMYVLLNGANGEQVIETLKSIFGIQSFSPAVRADKRLESIQQAGLELVKNSFREGKTFKVSARRGDKTFEYDSNDLNHLVGGYILKNIGGIRVDVKHPDIELLVDVRKNGVYLSTEVIKGAGGLPVGSSGKAMLMLSGGIDSPVAGYLAMKRGVKVEAVHFHSPPFTSPRAKQKALDLAEKISAYSGSIKVHIVPFTKIQETIHKGVPEGYSMTVQRRVMLEITDRLRKIHNGLAIVTGESLGQVASQTLDSMVAINDVTTTPVLRPLISMDKLEIIEMAQKIDTYEISSLPYEDCCTIFTPPAPKTRPKVELSRLYESRLDMETLIEEAVQHTETVFITPNQKKQEEDLSDLL